MRHLPPPTKYGGTVQKKAAGTDRRQKFLPPPPPAPRPSATAAGRRAATAQMMESDSSGAFGVLVWRAPKAEGVPNPKTVRTTLSALPETPVVIPKKRGISRLTVFKGPMRDSHWEIECEADPGEESRNQGVKYIKIDLTDRSYRFYYNSAKIKGGAGRFARPRTSYIVDPPVSPGALYSIFSTIALENGPWRGLDEGYNCQTFVDYFLQALGATQV